MRCPTALAQLVESGGWGARVTVRRGLLLSRVCAASHVTRARRFLLSHTPFRRPASTAVCPLDKAGSS